MQLAADTVVAGRFRLNRLLGRGGMGSVWHATHLGLDVPCAVKFIEGEFAASAEAQGRFQREAKAAAQLRSPHVVQILDHGISDGVPYIAMELLDGEDLGKRLARVGRLSPHEVHTVMVQVCRALSKAHGLGIVHRDLKPDNIFLVRDDDREIAKVLDFGIAKANANQLDGSNTKTGAVLGTPYYMSPEQAQGTKAVDHRSDLWSLAVIVYQAITGRLPFDSEALGDLLVKIIVSPVPVPSQVAPDIPIGFDQWWARAASRDPAVRFQTAKEFAESLGVVFGISQLTDVMDRGPIRAAMQSVTGEPAAPGFSATPRPALPSSAGGMVAQATGSLPGVGPAPGHGSTGAPIARTFADMPAGVPRKGPNVALFAGIGAVALACVLAVGGAMLFGGKSAPPASAGAPPATEEALAEKPRAAEAPALATAAPEVVHDTAKPAEPAAPVEPATAAAGDDDKKVEAHASTKGTKPPVVKAPLADAKTPKAGNPTVQPPPASAPTSRPRPATDLGF
jgi:serine/threonine-protein kinase